MLRIFISLLIIFKVTIAFSHSQLIEILPKDNVIYKKIPPKIIMNFKSLVKIVKIDVKRIENNETIKLDLSTLKRSKEYHLPMPELNSGKYRLTWRALSPDGHIIKGKSDFEVK